MLWLLMVVGKSWFAVLLSEALSVLEVAGPRSTGLMHAGTCATSLISLHPATSHLQDKTFLEQIHHSCSMMDKTSVLRRRRGGAFSLTLTESKQSPFFCGGS